MTEFNISLLTAGDLESPLLFLNRNFIFVSTALCVGVRVRVCVFCCFLLLFLSSNWAYSS